MVCLHTGFAALLLEMERDPDADVLASSCAVLDGGDSRLLQWITDSGLAVLIADNYAVRGHAFARGAEAAGRVAAAARALPVQARHPSRRDLVPERAGGVARRAPALPLLPHRAAAQDARRGRFAGHPGRHRCSPIRAASARLPAGARLRQFARHLEGGAPCPGTSSSAMPGAAPANWSTSPSARAGYVAIAPGIADTAAQELDAARQSGDRELHRRPAPSRQGLHRGLARTGPPPATSTRAMGGAMTTIELAAEVKRRYREDEVLERMNPGARQPRRWRARPTSAPSSISTPRPGSRASTRPCAPGSSGATGSICSSSPSRRTACRASPEPRS